jgi:hypothetical protein
MTRVPTAASTGHVDERRDHMHSPMLRFEAFRHWKSLTVLLNISRSDGGRPGASAIGERTTRSSGHAVTQRKESALNSCLGGAMTNGLFCLCNIKYLNPDTLDDA